MNKIAQKSFKCEIVLESASINSDFTRVWVSSAMGTVVTGKSQISGLMISSNTNED